MAFKILWEEGEDGGAILVEPGSALLWQPTDAIKVPAVRSFEVAPRTTPTVATHLRTFKVPPRQFGPTP
jgi:hypothetical protein